MSKGVRFQYAALGLVAGVGLALLFLVWAVPGFSDPTYQQIAGEAAKQNDQGDPSAGDGQKPEWWYWSERLFSAEDTLAQWIAAFAAIASAGVSIWAVSLVRNTLEQTRLGTEAAVGAAEAAIENNRIIQAEQRPWITLEREIPCEFSVSGERGICNWKYGLRNRGKLPAHRVRVNQKLIRGRSTHPLEIAYRAFVDDARRNALKRSGTVIFPSDDITLETTTMCTGTFTEPGKEYALLVCVTYQHAGGIGIDAHLLGISASQKGDALPLQHELLSFGWVRIVE